MSNDRQPNVVSFTFETTVDYDVDLVNETVTRRDDGTIDGEHHYIALFCEGEFAGEYHLGDPATVEDAPLILRAEKIMDEAMRNGTVLGTGAADNVVAVATEAMEILLAGCSPSTRDLLSLEGIKAVDYLDEEELLCHVDEILSQYHDVARTEADEGTDLRLLRLRGQIEPLIEDSPYLHHQLLGKG